VLGVVGDGYRPLQNADAFRLADDLVDSGRAHWIGAGATRGGARVHAVMRLDREIRIGDSTGEDVLPLLVLRNGHDGGLALTIGVAPFRLACLNGMLLPVTAAARTWKARHTATIGERLHDARRTLEIAWTYYDELEDLGARLLARRVSRPEVERIIGRLVPDPTGPAATERRRRAAEEVRLRLIDVYDTTPDLADIRGTRWGVLQAVTAFHDHHARTRTSRGRSRDEARFERATEPAAIKDRALALLTED
jgi:phage/plasmid-like protein (TIGR03299 family)